MMLAKVASNLTTIWHNYQSLFLNSNTYRYFSHLYNLDRDRSHWGPPDFSEFKDPWENYSEQTDPFLQNDTHQATNNKQYYHDNNLVYHEPYRLDSQNQCGPPESSSQIPLHPDGADESLLKTQSSQEYTCDYHVTNSQNTTVNNFIHSSQDHNHHLPNESNLHDNRNSNDSHDQKLTDLFPDSSPHTSNPNNVTTQLSASPCIENANVSSLLFCFFST